MPAFTVRIVRGHERLSTGELPRGRVVEAEVTFTRAFTAAPAEVALESVVVADGADGERHHCSVPVLAALDAGARLLVGGLLVPDAPRVRFEAFLQGEDGGAPVDGSVARTGEFTFVDPSAPAVLSGLVGAEFPCVYDVLQRHPREADVSDDLDGLVRFVSDGLRQDLDWVFDTPEYHVEGEIDADGNPVDTLAPWQRQAILRYSGLYYSGGPRRTVPWAQRGLGSPLTGVCNNLADILSTLRGCPPVDSSGFGLNASNLTQAQARYGGEVLTAYSSGAVRPGTIFLVNGDPSAPEPRHPDPVHINTVLRVKQRRRGGARQFQVFDTGGLGQWRPMPSAYGKHSGLLKEEPFRGLLNTAEQPNRCGGQAWFPIGGEPPAAGEVFASPSNASPTFQFPEGSWQRGSAEEVRARLLAGVERPLVRLAVFDRGTPDAGPVYLSVPFVMRVTLLQLFASIVNLPQALRYEARWLVQAGYRHGGRSAEASSDRGRGQLVLELYNDEHGLGRCWRPGYDLDRVPGFTSRVGTLLADAPAPYLPDPASEPPDTHPELNRVLAEALTRWTPGSLVVAPSP